MMLDISQLAKKLDFEEEDVVMLLEMFMESSQQSLKLLRAALETSDFPAIKEHAHAIKGSASNLLLDEIYQLSKSIEEASITRASFDYATAYTKLYHQLNNLKIMETA